MPHQIPHIARGDWLSVDSDQYNVPRFVPDIPGVSGENFT
jgi:hypothetical protein